MNVRTILTGVLVCALAGALAAGIAGTTQFAPLMHWYTVSWILFAAAAWALRRVPARHAAILVLAGGALIAGTGLLTTPRTSDDAYRYVWDGRVQAQGISPYDHAPDDPALADLRDDLLFPPGTDCTGMWDFDGTCTRINRPAVHTIYPPVAEFWFLLVHWLSFGANGLAAIQVAGWLLAMGTTVLLLYNGRAPATVALWAWCPAVALEAVNNGHVDALGTLLTVAAFGVYAATRCRGSVTRDPSTVDAATRSPRISTRRELLSGTLLGAGIAAKMFPAVTLPGILSGALRERRWRALIPVGAAFATVVVTYLPYMWLSHGSVLGYLGGYADEEGYSSGTDPNRYAVLRALLPRAWEKPTVLVVLAGLVLVAVVLGVMWRGDPLRPWRGALTVTGTVLLLMTPGYAWYALLLVGLVALDGRWEWLAVAVGGATSYGGDGPTGYTIAAVVVLVGVAVRGYLHRDQTHRHRPRRDAPA